MIEELGLEATERIFKNKPTKLYENIETNGDQIHIWACLVDKKILKEIKLDISSGGIEILRKIDLNKIKFATFKDTGLQIKDLENITIFETPQKTIEKAFTLF